MALGNAWISSGQLEFTPAGRPALGATAEFFVGGTTTPLRVYTDMTHFTWHPNPVVADGNGRWPLVIIAYCASFDVKVSTAGGTELYYFRELPNAEPFVAGDTPPVVDSITTGDIIFSPKTGTRTGFVRINGRTIGSGASGASERANDDCEALFLYNWNNFSDAVLPVTSGRGGSAAADWAANKRIALLDARGAVLRGVDDMGAAAAGRLTFAGVTIGSVTTGGSVVGSNLHTLTEAELAAHTHTTTVSNQSADHTHSGTTAADASHTHTVAGTTAGQSQTHTHTYNGTATTANFAPGANTGLATDASQVSGTASVDHTHTFSVTSGAGSSHSHTFTSGTQSASHNHTVTNASTGSSDPHNIVSQCILVNLLQKL